MGGPSQIISSHIENGSPYQVPRGNGQPPADAPKEVPKVAVGKGAPNGAEKVIKGDDAEYTLVLKGPPRPKIAPHDKFVRDLYAEATKLSSKRSIKDLDGLVKMTTAIDKRSKAEIKRMVGAVKTSVAALNKLTGRQIANFHSSMDKTALNALNDVLKAHDDLAVALMRLGAGKRDPAVSRSLQIAGNGLNQRICAITQLVGQLNEQLFRADSSGLELRNQYDRVGQLAAKRSGVDEIWMAKLKKLTQPLENELKKFASPSKPITQATVDTAKAKLQRIGNDVDFLVACASGKQNMTEEAKNRLKGLGWEAKDIVRISPSAFKDIHEVLDRASKQLCQAHLRSASKAAARRMVGALQIPGKDMLDDFRKQIASDTILHLGDMGSKLKDLFNAFDGCRKICENLRETVDYEVEHKNVDDSKKAVPGMLLQALGEMLAVLKERLSDAKLLAIDGMHDSDTLVKKKYRGILDKLMFLSHALDAGGGVVRVLEKQVGKIRDLIGDEPKGRSWYDSQVMSRLLDEPEVFMTVVEARVHGIDLSRVDFDCSTDNLVKKEPLRSGTFSTAYLCTFKRPDGSTVQRVFKPDVMATDGLLRGIHTTYGGGDKELQHAVDYNVALHDVAMLLGAGHSVCRSSAAYVDGEFGFLMEVAPGVDGVSAEKDNVLGKEVSLNDFDMMQKGEKLSIVAQMAQQLNQLQWTDLIGGQIDRHSRNYAINVTKDGLVSIKGFDNDQSLAAEMVGIGKVRVPSWTHILKNLAKNKALPDDPKRVEQEVAALKERFTVDGKKLYVEDSLGRPTFDVRALKSAKQLALLINGTGLRSIGVPSYMDRGTYDRIMTLTKDDKGLKLFRDTLEKYKLSHAQIDAAIKRLVEAKEIAEQLMKANRVYTREQLMDEKTLKELFNGDGQLNEMVDGVPLDRKYTNLLANANSYGSDYLHRPPFAGLVTGLVPQENADYVMEVRK